MTITIIPCKQSVLPEDELLLQFGNLKLKKTETFDSHKERSCSLLFPGDATRRLITEQLMAKSVPLLEKCSQHLQLSLRRVFDIMLYAQHARDTPSYLKKGVLRRTLFVDKKEFYIVLKSKGGRVRESDKSRLTLAIRVPFEASEKASLVYQLVNRDSSRRLSVAELFIRNQFSVRACANYKDLRPRLLTAFAYVKHKNGTSYEKAAAFVEVKEVLSGFNPRNDQLVCSEYYLVDYVARGDADSVHYIVEHLQKEESYYNYSSAFKTAAFGKRYDILLILLQKNIIKDNKTLLEALPKTFASAEEKAITRALINACTNRDEAVEAAYLVAAACSLEQVEFVLGLGDLSQECHIEALAAANDLQVVAFIASKIIDIHLHAGSALEHAAYCQKWKTVYYLAEKGVDVNYSDEDDGFTALYYAVYNGAEEAAKQLLDLGADPTIPTGNGHRPIYWAAKLGHDKIVALLLERSQNRQENAQIVASAKIDASAKEDSDTDSLTDSL